METWDRGEALDAERAANPSTSKVRASHGILEAGSRLREEAECPEVVVGYEEVHLGSRASSEGSTGSVCAGIGVAAGGGAPAAPGTSTATAGGFAAHDAGASRQVSGSSAEGEMGKGKAEGRAEGEGDYMVSVAKRRTVFEQGLDEESAREGWRANRPPGAHHQEKPAGSQGSGNSHRGNNNNSNPSNNKQSNGSSRSHDGSTGSGGGSPGGEMEEGERQGHANGGPLVSSQGVL